MTKNLILYLSFLCSFGLYSQHSDTICFSLPVELNENCDSPFCLFKNDSCEVYLREFQLFYLNAEESCFYKMLDDMNYYYALSLIGYEILENELILNNRYDYQIVVYFSDKGEKIYHGKLTVIK